jgi:two-component sensor histidine kinase
MEQIKSRHACCHRIALTVILLIISRSGICQGPTASYAALFRRLASAKHDTAKIDALADLSKHFYYKANQTPADRDSCARYANQVITAAKQTNDVVREAEGYQLLGNYARAVGQLTESRQHLHRAIEIFEREKKYLILGEAYFDYSLTFGYDKQFQDKIRAVEKSKDAFQKSGNIKKQADIHKELADILTATDPTKAFFLAKKALAFYTRVHHADLQGVYDILGHICFSLGNPEGALQYGVQALNAAIQSGDTGSLQLATIHNRIGLIFFSLKKFGQATEHFSEGLKIAKKFNDQETVITIACNLASTMIKMAKADQALDILTVLDKQFPHQDDRLKSWILPRYVLCFAKLRKFEEGQQYCDKLVTVLAKFSDAHTIALGASALAQFFTDSKQFSLAQKYLFIVDTLSVGVPAITRATNQMRWFKLDSTTGNWLSAIKHYQIAKSLEDSTFSEAKSRHIEFLEMQLVMEKNESQIKQKQQDIDLLQEQDKIKEASLAQHALTNNVIATGIILTLVVTFLLIVNIRHRYKTHQQLQEKQLVFDQTNAALSDLVREKEWLVNEIHHRVNANFQSVISLLDAQTRHMQNEKAIYALEDSKHRIQTMALVHKKLFASDNYDTIRFDEYIINLIAYLRESFETDRILDFKLNIRQVELHFSYGQPLGMIISEAVTNAIKYAFPDGRRGIVSIDLIVDPNEKIVLTIQDNGIGFPEDRPIQKTSSMGMNLIVGLCQEIDAKLRTYNDGGATIQITFTYDRPSPNAHVGADSL